MVHAIRSLFMPFTTENAPGMADAAAPETRGFRLNHSMLRVKDPERALAFYNRVFGMRLLRKLDFPRTGLLALLSRRPGRG
jgi:lactoylglutathione lyase